MSRYIDADKLRKDEIARCHCVPCVGSCDNNWKDLDEVLNDAPTADVEEVRHGYWTFKNTTYCHYGCFCSVCGKKSGIGGIRENQLKPYCPNCGAKMDGERSENGKGNSN